jgi:hypothetical protein
MMSGQRHPIKSLDDSAGIHSLGLATRVAITRAIHALLNELLGDMPNVNAGETAGVIRQELLELADDDRHLAAIRHYIQDKQAEATHAPHD